MSRTPNTTSSAVDFGVPAELAGTAASVDRLADTERAAIADATLISIASATRPGAAHRASTPGVGPRRLGLPGVVFWGPALAAAAAVAVVLSPLRALGPSSTGGEGAAYSLAEIEHEIESLDAFLSWSDGLTAGANEASATDGGGVAGTGGRVDPWATLDALQATYAGMDTGEESM